MPETSRDRTIMGDIVERLDALNAIVQDLLIFARPREPKIAPLALAELIESTAALLKKDPAHAAAHVTVRGDRPTINADAEQLQIVMLNLLLNAAQAAGASGEVRVSVASQNGLCRIAIADSGPGIPADIRDRIFEPFFTTKHRGTGLGLPTARRIVERHHGEIAVACPTEGGTIVTVTLPVSAGGLPQSPQLP